MEFLGTPLAMIKKELQIFLFICSKKNKYFVLKGLQHVLHYIYQQDFSYIINYVWTFQKSLRSNSCEDLIKIDESCNPKVDYGDGQHQRWEELLL